MIRSAPGQVAVIGGGRWARVIGGELLRLLPSQTQLSFHSPTNAQGMHSWVQQQGRPGLAVLDDWPRYDGAQRPGAVLVANAARDHVQAALPAVEAGVPTFVEKPLAPSHAAAETLVARAARAAVPLATSRVFLFTRYLGAFAATIARLGHPRAFRLTWTDPRQESRHGEAKRYDAAVTCLQDVLPHVLPILQALFSGPVELTGVEVSRGGSTVELQLRLGATAGRALIARNSDQRRRQVLVDTAAGPVELDFAGEPGTIAAAGSVREADPLWASAPRPLGTMLAAFLKAAGGAPLDPRLSAIEALETLAVIDQAMALYRPQQAAWLAARTSGPPDPDVEYAQAELSAIGQADAVPPGAQADSRS